MDFALTCGWAVVTDHAASRLYGHHLLQQRTMLRRMRELGYDIGGTEKENAEEIATLENAHGSIKEFAMPPLEQRGASFQSGKDLYLHFRNLSPYVHMGTRLVDVYAHDLESDHQPHYALRNTPNYPLREGALLYQFTALYTILLAWLSIAPSNTFDQLRSDLDSVGRDCRIRLTIDPE